MWAIKYVKLADNSENVIYICLNNTVNTDKFAPTSYKNIELSFTTDIA